MSEACGTAIRKVSSRSAAVSLGRPGFDLLCWFFLLFPFSHLCLLDYSEYKTH